MIQARTFIVALLLAGCFTAGPLAAQPDLIITEQKQSTGPAVSELLRWREEFTYEVRYSFFNLGRVQVVMTDTLFNGRPAWQLSGIITSSGIPFVGREENHYNSIFRVDAGKPKELVYWKDDFDDNKPNEDRNIFDYEMGKVYAFDEGEAADTLDLEEPATSGPLVFLFSRMLAGSQTTSRLFIYLEDQKGTIDMKHTATRDFREYDAFEEEVNTYYSEGDADIDGPFGFRGRFKAWFGTDSLRVPLEAHVKVWMGNVKVRLIDYKKELRNGESTF
ncbi:MAG: DUF3108 domain-containing protein [Balneolaceae bacterium]|nr:DUF3108 domain-containing protein [Balneolaceae bacterium]